MTEIALRLGKRVVGERVHMRDAKPGKAAETVALKVEVLAVALAWLEQVFGPWRCVEGGFFNVGADFERRL